MSCRRPLCSVSDSTTRPIILSHARSERDAILQDKESHHQSPSLLGAHVYTLQRQLGMTFTSFPQLVTYIGFSVTFFTVLAVSSLFVLRRRPGWQRLPAVSIAFPLVPVSYLLVGGWMTYYGFMLRPAISAAAVLTLITGAEAYYIRFRTGGTHKDLRRTSS